MLGKQKGKPPKDVVENYKRWAKLQDDMGQTILELMRHPNATLEQLWAARLQYADNHAEFNDMRKQLRKMYWDGGSYFEKYPWNN
jgi:uncharacterized FlgJ-related protein